MSDKRNQGRSTRTPTTFQMCICISCLSLYPSRMSEWIKCVRRTDATQMRTNRLLFIPFTFRWHTFRSQLAFVCPCRSVAQPQPFIFPVEKIYLCTRPGVAHAHTHTHLARGSGRCADLITKKISTGVKVKRRPHLCFVFVWCFPFHFQF